MPQPILTLTTDFGLADHYVGAMKGVILTICPGAKLVDISHQVPPFAVASGAYTIAQAYRYFPPGTVHVVVVDPGVGSSRRPLLMQAAGQYFVAPDNGVLALVQARESHQVRAITSERYFLHPVSQTFHGRDVFAPVAAHLAAGVPPARMGKPIDDWLRPAFQQPLQTGAHAWTGCVLSVDHFGNIITNFPSMPDLARGKFVLTLGKARISLFHATYADAPADKLFTIAGSAGYLEVSLAQASAAARIGCRPGAPCRLRMR